MTTQTQTARGPFKIWRNPGDDSSGPNYLGDYYPPNQGPQFRVEDLTELGFPPGVYTIRVPEWNQAAFGTPPWQQLEVLP